MRRSLPLWLVGALFAACAARPPSAEQSEAEHFELERLLERTPAEKPAPGRSVRLAFGAGADLDLYVTDSSQETVYFGNTPRHDGGELLRDLRCDDPSPRIEEVELPQEPAGWLRVGVDAPEACDSGIDLVPFVVEVRAGAERWLERGVARPGRFEVRVLEVDTHTSARSR
jgi:hypothetical protein